jgi:protein-tyrosine phosphatase
VTVASPYWINDQLAIVPRPRGGDWLDDEMSALRTAGIDAVVSMLEESEAAELGLDAEGGAARSAQIEFVSFPIPDRGVPMDTRRFREFLAGLERQILAGKRVGVHCRACIGRSSVVVGSLLMRSGMPPAEVWQAISDARGFPVPDTQEQREWVERHIGPNPR